MAFNVNMSESEWAWYEKKIINKFWADPLVVKQIAISTLKKTLEEAAVGIQECESLITYFSNQSTESDLPIKQIQKLINYYQEDLTDARRKLQKYGVAV